MNRSYRSLAFVALLGTLVFTGAGCFGKQEIDASKDGGVWRSVDAGANWQQSSAVPTASGVSSAAGTSVLTLVTDPTDPMAVYAGLEKDGMIYSYDAGASWQQPRDTSVRAGAVTGIAVDPSTSCRVYVARGERVFRSEDCSRTFTEVYVETKPGVIATALAIDWFQSSHVYIGFSDGTILKTLDRGDHWATTYRGRQAVTSLLVSQADSRVVYAGMAGAGLARSLDAGGNWEALVDPFRPYKDAARIVTLTEDGTGSALYAATNYGILRSFDQGATWEALTLLTAPNQVVPNAIAVDPGHPNVLLYSVGNSLYRTEDAGAQWSVEKLPTTRTISAIRFHRTDSNVIYLGLRKLEK